MLNYLSNVGEGDNLSTLFKSVLDNPVSKLTRCACCQTAAIVAVGEDRDGIIGFPNEVSVNENNDWNKGTGGHKKECRREFRKGDLVMLKGLKSEMNGSMALVYNVVQSQDEAVQYSVFNLVQKEKVEVQAKNMALKIPAPSQGLLIRGLE
ncbi:hypothetical protein HDU76_008250 [Blyttiomyces sp. JEL0837]|nr:hypothetical protein HDU76_008250 [Blyttiomyces sp. JEL0837]